MNLINLGLIEKKFSQISKTSIVKLNSTATKSAVMCLFFEKNKKTFILLTKRSELLGHHAGEISFPGGSEEEEDKDSLNTALRETFEEVGILKNDIKVIGRLDDYITGTGFHIKTHVGILKSLENLSINKNEVSEVIFLPVDILADNSNLIWTSKTFEDGLYKFWKINYLEHNIWGATAAILVCLASRIWNKRNMTLSLESE